MGDKADIEKSADRLLDVALGDSHPLPVDVRSICEKLGYTVLNYTPDNKKDIGKVSGLISFEKKALLLSRYDGEQRQRFTTARVLGHVALHAHKGFDVIYKTENVNVKEEQDANYFAACLLMPKHIFIHYYKVLNGDVYQLAMKFSVSNKDTIKRAEQL